MVQPTQTQLRAVKTLQQQHKLSQRIVQQRQQEQIQKEQQARIKAEQERQAAEQKRLEPWRMAVNKYEKIKRGKPFVWTLPGEPVSAVELKAREYVKLIQKEGLGIVPPELNQQVNYAKRRMQNTTPTSAFQGTVVKGVPATQKITTVRGGKEIVTYTTKQGQVLSKITSPSKVITPPPSNVQQNKPSNPVKPIETPQPKKPTGFWSKITESTAYKKYKQAEAWTASKITEPLGKYIHKKTGLTVSSYSKLASLGSPVPVVSQGVTQGVVSDIKEAPLKNVVLFGTGVAAGAGLKLVGTGVKAGGYLLGGEAGAETAYTGAATVAKIGAFAVGAKFAAETGKKMFTQKTPVKAFEVVGRQIPSAVAIGVGVGVGVKGYEYFEKPMIIKQRSPITNRMVKTVQPKYKIESKDTIERLYHYKVSKGEMIVQRPAAYQVRTSRANLWLRKLSGGKLGAEPEIVQVSKPATYYIGSVKGKEGLMFMKQAKSITGEYAEITTKSPTIFMQKILPNGRVSSYRTFYKLEGAQVLKTPQSLMKIQPYEKQLVKPFMYKTGKTQAVMEYSKLSRLGRITLKGNEIVVRGMPKMQEFQSFAKVEPLIENSKYKYFTAARRIREVVSPFPKGSAIVRDIKGVSRVGKIPWEQAVKETKGTVSSVGKSFTKATKPIFTSKFESPSVTPKISKAIKSFKPSSTPTQELPMIVTGESTRGTSFFAGRGVAALETQSRLSVMAGAVPKISISAPESFTTATFATNVGILSLVNTKPTPLTKQVQIPITKQKEIQISVPKTTPTTTVTQISIGKAEQIQTPIQTQTPVQIETPIQTQVPISAQITPQITQQPIQPKTTLPPVITRRTKAKKRIPKAVLRKAYLVEIRRRGLFGSPVKKKLPFGKAKRLGVKLTKESLASTFRLKSAGYTIEKDIRFKVPSKIYRRPKKPVGEIAFVERRGKRLTTRKEVWEIETAKKKKKRRWRFL